MTTTITADTHTYIYAHIHIYTHISGLRRIEWSFGKHQRSCGPKPSMQTNTIVRMKGSCDNRPSWRLEPQGSGAMKKVTAGKYGHFPDIQCLCIYICMYVCMCAYIYMCVYVGMCVYVYICVCVCVFLLLYFHSFLFLPHHIWHFSPHRLRWERAAVYGWWVIHWGRKWL